MNMVYFGENGLTSTSANFIANKSKELFDAVGKDASEISFINIAYTVAGTDEIQVNAGKDAAWLQEAIAGLKLTGKLKALNAWLREAIKEKENAESKIRRTSFYEWLRSTNQEPRTEPDYNCAEEVDIIEAMDIAERQKYLELEAIAANYGNVIHKDGAFAKARKLVKAKDGKKDVQGVGTPSLTVIEYSSSMPIEEIDKIFLALQEEYRSVQAELNGIKHTIKVRLNQENDRRGQVYKAEMQEYASWKKQKDAEYNSWINSEVQKISEMKIVIPDSLKKIYEFVKNS